ncbi:MAG: molybdopterin-dependent oxidoreductase, partial [Dehalococcoidia bacterium]|nr:molybdopterin-dependent oxidoreductase [Dehalococcoidia bacterium]
MARKEVSKKRKNDNQQVEGIKQCIKGIGFSGCAHDGNTAVIDVRGGKIVRIRPLHYDWKYDPKDFNPWKFEVRGKTFEPPMKTLIPPLSLGYKKRIYSPNRILYPMKRADWDPSGERNPQNRGKSGYVRISWGEALDIIASEINRIKEKYGMYAILSQSDGHGETKIVHGPHAVVPRLLNLLGGFTFQTRNPDSWEGWYWGAKHVWGFEPVGQQREQTNLMHDIAENTELLLFWGCDPETTPWIQGGQLASRLCYWFTELGIKSIFICPDLNYAAAVHADKWIPIRPNTDAALQLAIAYTWITKGTYDREYIATHTIGFDKFKAYVLGEEDSMPKTPQWAAKITGVPARIIKVLAHEWASKRTSIAHGNGGSMIRGPYSTEPARLEVLLLAMQGLGKPGCNQVKMMEWGIFYEKRDFPTPCPVVIPDLRKAHRGSAGLTGMDTLPKQIIAKDRIHDALLNPPISWYGTTRSKEPASDQFKKYTYPAEGCPEIHMIWSDTPSWITCWNDSNAYIKGLQSPKVEFILVQHPWLENDCRFADVLLPVNTKFEEDDIAIDKFNGQFNLIMRERKCIEPVGESRSDYEIVCMVAERMGVLKEFTEGRSNEEWIRYGFETSGVQNMVTFEELEDKGYWVVPADPDWNKKPAGLKKFYDAPDKHPLPSPTGKIEFESTNLKKHFPDDPERPPVPCWIEKGESHDESLAGARAKKYPLLIMSNHPRWRIHSQHDDMTWLREIPSCKVTGPDGYQYEPLWINPKDAEKRGIENGDVVKVFNERGAVLGGALVWERIMPGVVYMDHGARHDPIVVGELDRGGAINTISPHNTTSKNATGMATSGYLVEVERADLEEMRRKYPEEFSRP